jgi:hypothetical protein
MISVSGAGKRPRRRRSAMARGRETLKEKLKLYLQTGEWTE